MRDDESGFRPGARGRLLAQDHGRAERDREGDAQCRDDGGARLKVRGRRFPCCMRFSKISSNCRSSGLIPECAACLGRELRQDVLELAPPVVAD